MSYKVFFRRLNNKKVGRRPGRGMIILETEKETVSC